MMGKIINQLKCKKGGYILEATVIFPIFILSLIALVSIVGIIGNCEKSIFQASDLAQFSSIQRYYTKSDPIFPLRLTSSVEEKNGLIEKSRIYWYREGFRENGIDELVKFKLNNSFERIDFEVDIVFRSFNGHENISDGEPRDSFERAEESEEVYIFPHSGKKYHDENCRYVKESYMQGFLSPGISKKYSPCSRCSPDASAGNIVYYFPSSGEHYHGADCTHVDKYTVIIEKSDAIEKGYSPCSVCGG